METEKVEPLDTMQLLHWPSHSWALFMGEGNKLILYKLLVSGFCSKEPNTIPNYYGSYLVIFILLLFILKSFFHVFIVEIFEHISE